MTRPGPRRTPPAAWRPRPAPRPPRGRDGSGREHTGVEGGAHQKGAAHTTKGGTVNVELVPDRGTEKAEQQGIL